jgi:hypothetical protein
VLLRFHASEESLLTPPIRLAEPRQAEQVLCSLRLNCDVCQPFEPLAHVGDSGGQIDPRGWTQSKHGLRPLQRTHQALERIRIKIRMYLDPPAPDRTTASPQFGSCCVGDFLAASAL